MTQINDDIRALAHKRGIRLWQVADAYGLTDSNFSRLLRHQLSREKRDRIFEIIERLEKKEVGANGR